ncbi:MAG: hypothetical protein R3A79_07030 [Nannocystaceae bacterium]
MSTKTTPYSKSKNIDFDGQFEAAEEYREGVREHVDSGDVEEAAEAAKRAVEGDEAGELAAAEAEAGARKRS